MKACYLREPPFSVSSQKISLRFFSVGLPVLKKNPPSSMVDTVLVLQNLWQPLHTNLSARKRHRKDKKRFFFVCSLHSEADKEHSMDHSRPRVAGGEGVFSVILVCQDFERGCGMLLFLLLLGWLAVCCRGAPPWGAAAPIAICCCCIWCCKNCNCPEQKKGEKQRISVRYYKQHNARFCQWI